MKLRHLLAMSLLSFITNAGALDIGAPAPQISAIDDAGQSVVFADVYKKGPTLVYFYPKADTPGCTKQACSLRDSIADLQKRGLQIIGVSEDKVESQKAFKEKYQLPFPLIADSDGAVAKAFGVPTTMGFAKRQSFLVSSDKIVWNDLSVSPSDHTAKVEAALDALKK
jgi:thioredoxin-dependent peroxiredoxin